MTARNQAELRQAAAELFTQSGGASPGQVTLLLSEAWRGGSEETARNDAAGTKQICETISGLLEDLREHLVTYGPFLTAMDRLASGLAVERALVQLESRAGHGAGYDPAVTRELVLIRTTPGTAEPLKTTGIVADAVVFPDGTAVLHWRTDPAATELYPSEAAMRSTREASGRSAFWPALPVMQP